MTQSFDAWGLRRPVSRRALMAGTLGLAAGALLAACGGDDDDDAEDTPESASENDSEPDETATNSDSSEDSGDSDDPDGDTRTVEHAMGTTEVPAEPQRVVVLDMGEMDMALALGVQPVGAALYTAEQEFADYLQDEIGEYTRVGTVAEPDLEAIVALEPDLIISNMTRHEDLYDELSSIAPTVFAEALGAEWKESFEFVARALGREEEHQRVMDEYQDRIASFQKAMGDELENTQVTIVRSFPDEIRLYMKASFIGTIIEDSGLPRPPVQDQDIFMELISAERIRDLEADVIFTLYWNPDQGEQLSTLIENPLWDQLAAVEAGQVYEMDDEVWGTGLGPLGAMEVISDLEEVFIDGDIEDVYEPEEGEETAEDEDSENSESGDSDAFPITIEHKYGSTEITERPERIVLVGLVEQDALLAMDVVPVATREWFGEQPGAIFPWAQDELGDAETPEVLDAAEIDFERVSSLEPDVIIGLYAGLTQEEYDTLSEIAPTVAQPEEYVDWGIPWQELTLKIGRIIGKEQEAEDLITEIEDALTQVREEHPDFEGLSGAVASPFGLPENYYVYGSQDARGRFIEAIGFDVPDFVDEMAGESFGASISVEQFDLIADLDALIWVSAEEALADVDLYQTLPVVQEGRVLYFGEDNSIYHAFNFSSVLSLPFLIDNLIPMLETTIDGDPETTTETD